MIFKSWSKIILFNTIVFLACLLIIEVIFGEWFSKYNLGPYMRDHRLKKNPVVLLHENKNYCYSKNNVFLTKQKYEHEKNTNMKVVR